MRKHLVTLALVLGILVIVGSALVVDARRPGADERFVGTDTAATRRIEQDHPGYVPWFSPLFAPTSQEVESGLFALQAAGGGLVLGYCFGALRTRRRMEAAQARAAAGPPAP